MFVFMLSMYVMYVGCIHVRMYATLGKDLYVCYVMYMWFECMLCMYLCMYVMCVCT